MYNRNVTPGARGPTNDKGRGLESANQISRQKRKKVATGKPLWSGGGRGGRGHGGNVGGEEGGANGGREAAGEGEPELARPATTSSLAQCSKINVNSTNLHPGFTYPSILKTTISPTLKGADPTEQNTRE